MVTPEVDTTEAVRIVTQWRTPVSSILTRIEVPRALRRSDSTSAWEQRLQQAFSRIAFKDIDSDIVYAAARLDPPVVRSLDAIHLATALSFGDDLGAFLTYDRRLAEAARAAGVQVLGVAF